MEDFFSYQLKSVVWLTGFAIVYLLFLRKERFFILKRAYLIAGIFISFLFPLVTINYSVELPAPAPFPQMPDEINSGFTPMSSGSSSEQASFNYMYLFLGIYLSGIIFILLKNLRHFSRLFAAMRKSSSDNIGTARLIRTSEYTSSFSFFNYVFVNPAISDDEMKEIVNHELVHVTQKHWFDLLLGEILRMLQWANPFAWIYTGFIRLNHEYLADEVALQRSSDPALYKAALLNQVFRAPVISLSNSFNYSITKTRFDMMKKIVTSPYRKLRILFILPVFAVIFYAFSTPEYYYAEEAPPTEYLTIPVSAPIVQQVVKGIVRDETGNPVEGATISQMRSAGGGVAAARTDKDGRFQVLNVTKDEDLMIRADGYKAAVIKADFTIEVVVKLEKSPQSQAIFQGVPVQQRQGMLVVIDGEMSQMTTSEVRKALGYNFGTATMLQGKAATDKYGEKGANGVFEVLTRKKALEMGLNPPYPRLGPADFPTFQGSSYAEFNKWVGDNVKYPDEARAGKQEGWVFVNFVIEPDGRISNMTATGQEILKYEVLRVVNSAPGFDPPKNTEVREPFNHSIGIRFKLPEEIIKNGPYVVVQEMPVYPGGDAGLLQFVKDNTRYPEGAKADKAEGRVIVRFIVTPEGSTEGATILKGINPLLDKEAVRVAESLKGWQPGKQDDKPVYVWYMCPVNFTAPVE